MTDSRPNSAAYHDLRTYADDLLNRIAMRRAWVERHPDHATEEYNADFLSWQMGGEYWKSGISTFDPNDPEPRTADLLTAERFTDLMLVALAAYEGIVRDE